jgi:hypothetical protein
MNIKNLLACLAAMMIIVTGCKNSSNEKNYTISGTIQHAAKQKILLQEVPYGGKTIITLDSATIGKDGKYKFEFIAKQEGIYKLSNQNNVEIIFINDADNIQINADTENYLTYTTKGSESTTEIFNLLKEYRKKDSSLFATLYSLDILQKQNGKDSTIFWLKKQKNCSYKIEQFFIKTKN